MAYLYRQLQVIQVKMEYYCSLSNEQLLVLLKDGDQQAFATLYDRNWEEVLTYVFKAIGSLDEAQDIVQEIFISIWRRRGEIAVSTSFKAYLLKSARNLSIRHMSKAGVKSRLLQELADQMHEAELSFHDSLELDELEARVDKAVENLPPKMREIFILNRNENLSYREIAETLGISEMTVKKQISNARKSIRAEMEHYKVLPLFLLFF